MGRVDSPGRNTDNDGESGSRDILGYVIQHTYLIGCTRTSTRKNEAEFLWPRLRRIRPMAQSFNRFFYHG
jgi:hypothetical protein